MVPTVGCAHLWSGARRAPTDRQQIRAWWASSSEESAGLTPWIAAPLLIVAMLFRLLLVTGTTIREVPRRRAGDVRGHLRSNIYDDEYDKDDDDDARPAVAEDLSDERYYDDPAAFRADDAAWRGPPSAAPDTASASAPNGELSPSRGPHRRHAHVAGQA